MRTDDHLYPSNPARGIEKPPRRLPYELKAFHDKEEAKYGREAVAEKAEDKGKTLMIKNPHNGELITSEEYTEYLTSLGNPAVKDSIERSADTSATKATPAQREVIEQALIL